MNKQLALWKQLAVVAVLGAIGYGAWFEGERIMQYAGYASEKGDETRARRGGGQEGRGRGRRRGGGDNAVPVIVEAVKSAQAVDIIRSIGDGRANRSLTLYPKQTGIVATMTVQAGQRVDKDQEILQLDKRQEEIAVGLAEAKLTEAKGTLDRSKQLLQRNAISEAVVETAQATFDTARLELERARQNLADRSIRAPFAGVLGIPSVEEGDLVTQSTQLITLDDRSVIKVVFDVSEIFLSRVKPGLKVKATSRSFRDRVFEGEIKSIDSRVNEETRTVRIRAELPNAEDLLRSGMSFIVTVALEGDDYPSIDELALRWEREGAYVWRVADEKADKVRIEVVKRIDGRILVTGDLEKGQLIAVEGTQRLRQGRKVSFEAPREEAIGSAGL